VVAAAPAVVMPVTAMAQPSPVKAAASGKN